MKTKFVLRKDSKNVKAPLYLHITGNSNRERLNLDLHIEKGYWNEEKQKLVYPKQINNEKLHTYISDTNLILDNLKSKITKIKTVYRLSEQVLTPALLKRELIEDLPRVNFCSYYKYKLNEEKSMLKIGTYKKLEAVLVKLERWRPEIYFNEINESWFRVYKLHLKKLGNKDTTINSNVKSVKKYLKLAIKDGIKIPVDLDTIIVGSTEGTKISLKPNEVKTIYNFFNSEFIIPSHKVILGYFLFCCATGLRFSDVMKIKRSDFDDGFIQFVAKKTEKNQTISLNKMARNVVQECPDLFHVRFTNIYINRELKKIMLLIGIRKKVTFHVSRHTFATSFLRAGGSVEKLQILLGHSDIETTMIYVHIVAAEANKDIHLLDNLF